MSQLADRHIELNAALRKRTVEAVTRIWYALPDHRDGSLATWLQTVPSLIEAARRQQIAITEAYLARALDRPVTGVSADQIIAGYRNGADPQDVYKRPFDTTWTALADGTPYTAAAEQGLARAVQTASTDVQMAMRDTLTAIGQSEENIWGYERIANPGACAFCQELDGAQFRTESPLEIHPSCGCGVEPVVYTRGRANRDNVKIFENSPTNRPPSSEVAIRTHGELGPVIVDPNQAFDSAGNI